MKGFKKVLKLIVDILTLIVFLVLLAIIFVKVKTMLSDKDYFEVFGYSVFNVATGSMEPVIKQNDIIIVKTQDDYEIDDIVTFRSEGSYITHRIINKISNSIVTKGDANNAKDVAITKEDIVGKVIHIYSNLGVWQKVFTTPKIIIMIFMTLILFDFAFSYKGIKNKQNVKMVNKIKDISLKQVNEVAEDQKLSDLEIVELCKKTDAVKNGEEVKFDKKEKEFLNYTIRLDLSELQKQIDDKMNGE